MNGFPEKTLPATDESKDAVRATEAASDLAKRPGAELHVVHVWHEVPGFALSNASDLVRLPLSARTFWP